MTASVQGAEPPLGPWATQKWSLQQRLEALASFASMFRAPGFRFGEWKGGDVVSPGVISMGWFDLSDQAQRFFQACYDFGWVLDFDWNEWLKTSECRALYSTPDLIMQADAFRLARLVTTSLRMDKFCEGSLAKDFKNGIITKILERAAELCGKPTIGTTWDRNLWDYIHHLYWSPQDLGFESLADLRPDLSLPPNSLKGAKPKIRTKRWGRLVSVMRKL